MSANGKNEKTAHLVWCAMIALRLARQDGRVQSEQQENLFLVRWFAPAPLFQGRRLRYPLDAPAGAFARGPRTTG